mmetsp:Transcript_17858/g.23373  ORF Transcript_17858/g.23373 Transcript_17858/m.23373 type:complete len:88 (+) Transcript_17858:350-613(+)
MFETASEQGQRKPLGEQNPAALFVVYKAHQPYLAASMVVQRCIIKSVWGTSLRTTQERALKKKFGFVLGIYVLFVMHQSLKKILSFC